jgi:hypothetical protein
VINVANAPRAIMLHVLQKENAKTDIQSASCSGNHRGDNSTPGLGFQLTWFF